MRKYISILLLLFFCFGFSSPHHRIIARKNVSGLTPPTYYASAILSMNFEEGLNAFDSSGNAVLFTDSGSDIGAYGHTGQGMKMDDAGEDITLTQGANQYFNPGADQTLCMKVKITAEPDADVTIAKIVDAGGDDYLALATTTVPAVLCYYYIQTGTDRSAGSASIDVNTWEVIAYSWQGTLVGSNGDHSANPGGQATWGDDWEDDANELDAAMTNAPVNISIGSVINDPGNVEIIYIDEWALVGSYKFDCSTLFSPE